MSGTSMKTPGLLPGLLAIAFTILTMGRADAQGGAPASTLQRITETGTIRIGYSVEDFPFSYRDENGNVAGYSTELCVRVVDILRQELKLPAIEIAFVERNPRNRVSMLRSGELDIECVASTNNAERRKSVGFTFPHFVTGTQFVSLKASNLNTIADLAGHTVAATTGTTNIGQLNAVNRERSLNIAVMPVETHKDAFKLVTDGRASAFVMDGILLAALVAGAENPDDYAISSDALGWPEPYGLMVRIDDDEFRSAVNAALVQIYSSGEMEGLYARWCPQPIGPRGINLRLPMSAEVKKAFSQPSDPAQ